MLVYYLLYIVVIILPYLFKQSKYIDQSNIMLTNYSINRKYVIVVTIILVLLLGLRHPSMGVDLGYNTMHGYLGSFDILNTYSWKEILFLDGYKNYDEGYILFNKLIGSIYNNRQFFLFVCAALAMVLVGYVINKKSIDPCISYVIYLGLPVFLINFSGLRQSIAIAITFYSLVFIQSKKPLLFIITILVASFFHFSAIVFLIAYPIYYIKKNALITFLSIYLIIIIYIFKEQVFSFLLKLFRTDAILDYNGAITLFIIFFIIYFFVIIFSDQKDTKINGYTNLFFVAIACQAMGGLYSLTIRIGYYFMIYLCLLIPEVLNQVKVGTYSKYYPLFKIVFIIFFISFGLLFLYKSSWAMTNPYHFFWMELN